jgi:hypothetical protein
MIGGVPVGVRTQVLHQLAILNQIPLRLKAIRQIASKLSRGLGICFTYAQNNLIRSSHMPMPTRNEFD